jgi:hypothetical protein
MLRRILFYSLLLGSLTGLAAAQDRVAVFEFEGIGVDYGTAEAATHIFRNELNATGKFSVIPKGDMEAALDENEITDYACHAVACAAEYGYAIGAEKTFIGTLTRLGERMTAEIRMISVVRKEIVFTDRFSVTSVDDLDMALRKLAEAAASGKKIETELDRYAITEEETMEPRRRKGYITTGASFGFGFPLGDSYSGVDNIKTLAWVMRYEAGNYVVDNSIGISWGGGGEKDTIWPGTIVDEREVAIVPWDIGMRYIFNRGTDFTPFVGGGLGLHFIASQEYGGMEYAQSDQAFAFHIAGGVYGFQSYDFRLTIEAKYTLVFSDAFIDSGDSSHQLGISIGVSRKFEKEEKRGCMSGGCIF